MRSVRDLYRASSARTCVSAVIRSGSGGRTPQTIQGFAVREIYADARKWLGEGGRLLRSALYGPPASCAEYPTLLAGGGGERQRVLSGREFHQRVARTTRARDVGEMLTGVGTASSRCAGNFIQLKVFSRIATARHALGRAHTPSRRWYGDPVADDPPGANGAAASTASRAGIWGMLPAEGVHCGGSSGGRTNECGRRTYFPDGTSHEVTSIARDPAGRGAVCGASSW